MMLNPSRPPVLLRPFARLTRPLCRAGYPLTAESAAWWLLALVTYPATCATVSATCSVAPMACSLRCGSSTSMDQGVHRIPTTVERDLEPLTVMVGGEVLGPDGVGRRSPCTARPRTPSTGSVGSRGALFPTYLPKQYMRRMTGISDDSHLSEPAV